MLAEVVVAPRSDPLLAVPRKVGLNSARLGPAHLGPAQSGWPEFPKRFALAGEAAAVRLAVRRRLVRNQYSKLVASTLPAR